MYYTGAMKNLFGLVPSVTKSPMHVRFPSREAFAAMIVDLNLAVMPHYALMDAIIGMEGPGPGSGYPRRVGLILASSNLLAMDAAASEIVGYPPQEVPVSREALSRGIWLKSFSEIEYPLLSPAELRIPDFKKIPFKKTGGQLTEFLLPRPFRKFRERLTPRPEIDRSICLCCGDCTRICGSRAMTLAGEGPGRKVRIDYNTCIRCYCCHEICPVNAINIKQVPLREVLFPRGSNADP
jgi:ferredoxin